MRSFHVFSKAQAVGNALKDENLDYEVRRVRLRRDLMQCDVTFTLHYVVTARSADLIPWKYDLDPRC